VVEDYHAHGSATALLGRAGNLPKPVRVTEPATVRGRATTDASPSDSDLIEQTKQGDLGAYGELVRRYQRDARRTAAAVAGFDVAEDAAQEAFVRAYRSLHQLHPGARFRPWLLAIVANVARNQRRSAQRWARRAERSGEGRVDAGVAPSAEDSALAGRRRRDLHTALDALPARYREAVACRYLLDLSEAETAAVLGVPRGTVKSRLSRGLERLQRSLPSEVPDA
jgi:RNA polymerase sigma-70 factor (ECF subfamily)